MSAPAALVCRPRVPYDRAIVRRLLLPFVLVVLAASALSACQVSVSPSAARIGSQTISKATLNSAVSAVASDKGFLCTISQDASSATVSINGAGAGTDASDFADSQLTELIKQRINSVLVTKLHLVATPAVLSLATQRLDAELNPPSGSSCAQNGSQAVGALAPGYRSVLLDTEADVDLVSAHLAGVSISAAGLAAYARAHVATAYEDCASAILTTTKAAATTARDAIEAGQSFASVAMADSKDPNSAPEGGVLGCHLVSNYQPPLNQALATLAVGQVSQPIAFSTGYVLLKLTGRQAPNSFDALEVLVNAEQSAANAVLAKADSAANVSVDPEYGSWLNEQGDYRVVPPSGPASTFLPNPAAITPPTVPLG
jgi:parvulin-like peptidyl-prolyl isomerase